MESLCGEDSSHSPGRSLYINMAIRDGIVSDGNTMLS